jgi:hypothetical protein
VDNLAFPLINPETQSEAGKIKVNALLQNAEKGFVTSKRQRLHGRDRTLKLSFERR